MRTISLWQPWASLVAVGAKRVETRHWAPPRALIGHRIGIHAAKTTSHLQVCEESPFDEYVPDPVLLPLGAVVATAVLFRCRQITPDIARLLAEERPHEHAFGNYEPGRFGWILRDVQALEQPVAFRGSQGFFAVPDALLGFEAQQGVLLARDARGAS